MLQDYLARDESDLELSEDDFKAVEAAAQHKGVQALLKFCISRILAIEKAFFDPMRKEPLTETQTWGFIQARAAYYEIADFIMNPPIEEIENE